MSFDIAAIRAALSGRERIWRVLVAEARGSVPRGPGTSMLVWPDGQDGTIGGGRLEWEVLAAARAGHTGLHRHALGPALGQCCGGAVTLHIQEWTAEALNRIDTASGTVIHGPDLPIPDAPLPYVAGQSVIEAIAPARHPVVIWGSGHVGRALVATLSPFPDFRLIWVDMAADRFPDSLPAGVTPVIRADPADFAPHIPDQADHFILTHSHDLDLALCHGLLARPTAGIGLIGSSTKWARFRSRLSALGHSKEEIDRITCPIGNPTLGKHPQAIAIGVAVRLLEGRARGSG